jgi:hypothetical protein
VGGTARFFATVFQAKAEGWRGSLEAGEGGPGWRIDCGSEGEGAYQSRCERQELSSRGGTQSGDLRGRGMFWRTRAGQAAGAPEARSVPAGEVGQRLVQSASGRRLGAGCWSKTMRKSQIGQTAYGGEVPRGLSEPAACG